MTDSASIVAKLWNYCNVLRDDGVSYGDYVEQLTYLLFLKMADEQTKAPYNRPDIIPKSFNWQKLIDLDGEQLETQYRKTLENLAKEENTLGIIFRKSQNKIQDPAKLRRLITLIESETWTGLDADIKGDIYEGLLQKNAEDTKSGAGQYFTPRELIKALVEVIKPKPGETICDPACGTGGFMLVAHDYIIHNYQLDRDQKHFLKNETFSGNDIVDGVVRLCVMNLYLHGIEAKISSVDSLIGDPGKRYNIVITNPPFGKKSSITVFNGQGKAEKDSLIYERPDFWTTTSNKQLNFLQHIKTVLDINGRAAVVLPDNVLFEGGAGEKIRKELLKQFDVHTILRLPTGLFYAQGVKANVVFFDKKPASETPWTEKVWIYDLRTNIHFTLKTNSLKYSDLEDFIKCYKTSNRNERVETERFKTFTYDEIIKRDKTSLDIFWLKDDSVEDSANLPDPEVLADEIAASLEIALEQINEIRTQLSN